MKLLTFLFIVIPFFGFNQITLNNLDFSDGGDNIWVSTLNDNGIDFATTGQNMTWDFSGMVSTGQTQKQYSTLAGISFLAEFAFGTFASPDYKATNYTPSNSLPLNQLSQFLPVTISDVRQFSKNSDDSITSVGLSVSVNGTEIPFKSDTIETRYKFPMNYGDVYSSRGYSKLDMNPITNAIWIQYRQRFSTVDGWGSIITPYGTFNALRIDHFIQETDSLLFEIFGNATWIPLPIPDSHQYEWIASGEKEPILRITTSIIGGNETVTNIEYRDNEVVGLEELENQFTVYPNPANSSITIQGIQSKASYSILSIDGKEILSGELSPINNQVELSSISQGNYQLIIIQSGKLSVIPILKK